MSPQFSPEATNRGWGCESSSLEAFAPITLPDDLLRKAPQVGDPELFSHFSHSKPHFPVKSGFVDVFDIFLCESRGIWDV